MESKNYLWLIAMLLTCPQSFAENIEIDEIIVKADFRERPIAEIPSSVTIMDSKFINEAAVQHFEELINVVPNLNWSGDGNRARYFQIRGVGERSQYEGAPNPSIGFLVDDIDFSGIGTIATLFDIQSIEVLRGPQGSRYGANALGGLIYMRSTEPSLERKGKVQIGVAGDSSFSLGAALGGRLDKNASTTFRVSAHKHQSDGFRRNAYLNSNKTNGRDESTIRARLRYLDNDSFEANVSLMYANIDNGYDAFSVDNSYITLSDKPGKDAQESKGASLRLNWSEFGNGSLTSITSIAISDIKFSFDADWGNEDSWSPFTYDYETLNDRKRHTLSQEFRYEAENWLFGLYVLNLNDGLSTLNLGDYYDPIYDYTDTLNYTFNSDYKATNLSLFSQYNIEIKGDTHISTGLRFERRSTKYIDSETLQADPSETLWGGEIGIVHNLNDLISVFAGLSKGYKASGFNLGVLPENLRYYSDEALWMTEIGTKASLLNQSLFLNTSVFYQWRVDQQVRTSFQLTPGDPTTFGFAALNIDKSETFGLEAELNWKPHQDWQLYLNIGLLDGKFKKVPFNLGIDSILNRQQAHAPAYTLAGGIVYRPENGMFARLDVTAKDEFYFSTSHDQRSQSFGLMNARVGYEKNNWLISLWGRNLFNKEYAVRGFFFGNEPPNFPDTLYTRFGDPQQFGVTIEMKL
ncbi:MAG: TonB-dependent receptor [Gammaproteobacteria bacterium]|nr:TonB-dependent receptor [Gammaproteobacteria bacterium]|tara:strand:+ start:1779 stop:3851 length:2073 start_codon:yes stop_codon:yes gene_type:complete